MPILWVIIQFATAALLTSALNWVGLIPWRRAVDAHWTERARLLWPVRATAGANFFALPLILNLWQQFCYPEIFSMRLVNGLAALAGALLGTYPFDKELFPKFDFRSWRNQVIASWGIRLGVWTPLILTGLLMPGEAGWKMWLLAGSYLPFHILIQFGLVREFFRLAKFLQPPEPRLRQIVEATSLRMNVEVRRTWQIGGLMAGAFAFPTTRDLLFTKRLLEICSDEEIGAICAHELAHLSESKAVLAVRMLGSLGLFPLIFLFPSCHWLGVPGLLPPLVGTVFIAEVARRISRKMEVRADQTATSEQSNEGVYARALEKIYRENQSPAVAVDERQMHPHLYDRMLAAGITPDYPRPDKPEAISLLGRTMWIAVALLIVATLIFR